MTDHHLWKPNEFHLEQHWPRTSIADRRFPFSHQPLKTVYTLYYALSFPLRLVYFVGDYAYQQLFDKRAPKRTFVDAVSVSIGRSLIDELFIATVGGERGLYLQPLSESEARQYQKKAKAMPEILSHATIDKLRQPVQRWAEHAKVKEADHLTLWWLGSRGHDTKQPQATKGEKVIVYFSGGGYHVGTSYPQNDLGSLSARLMETLQEHSAKGKRGLPPSIVAVEYRKTSYEATPAALLDAISVYYHIVNSLSFEAGNVTLMGDSAGGHLVNCLVRYLVEGGEPVPGHIVLLSPWGDQAGTIIEHPNSAYQRNLPYDFLSDGFYHYCKDRFAVSLPEGNDSLLDVYFSPVAILGKVKTRSGDGKQILITKETEKDIFRGWPSTLLIASEYEILLDHSTEMYRRMKLSKQAEGQLDEHSLSLLIVDACHDPVVLPPFAFTKARRQIRDKIANWLADQ